MQNYYDITKREIPESRYFCLNGPTVCAMVKKYRKIDGISFDITKKKVIFVRFNAVARRVPRPSAIDTSH